MKTYTQVNATELRAQKYAHTYKVNQSMTKESRIYSGEKTVSSINDVGKTGQVHAKESNWTTFSHHTQK